MDVPGVALETTSKLAGRRPQVCQRQALSGECGREKFRYLPTLVRALKVQVLNVVPLQVPNAVRLGSLPRLRANVSSAHTARFPGNVLDRDKLAEGRVVLAEDNLKSYSIASGRRWFLPGRTGS